MKNYLLPVLFLLFSPFIRAQIQGPSSGSTFTTVAIPGSSQTWSNPGNAAASDNVYSTFGNLPNPAGSFTDYLVVTGFNFSIPANATISGIVVEVERSDPNGRTSDNSIRIVKNGAIGSSEYASGATYSFSDNSQSFGNAGELWGESWTAADINSPTFGIAISAKRSVSGGTTAGRIDNIRIAVFYDFVTLPVDLIGFRATKKNDIVQLTWITANEENMNYYEVERSADGSTYNAISRVNSQNKMYMIAYSINDEKPLNGKAWYRLKMAEKSGVVKYSSIVVVSPEPEAEAGALYPNPLPHNGILQVKNPNNEKLSISFYNNYGFFLGNASTSSNTVQPDDRIKNSRGIVYYRIINRNGQIVASGKLMLLN